MTALSPDAAARLAAEAPGLDLPEIPRRFCLYERPLLTDAPRLYCWGLQLRRAALVFFPDGGQLGAFASAYQLVTTLRHDRDLRLVWLDGEVAVTGELTHWRVTDPEGRRIVHVVTDRTANRMMVSVDSRPVMSLDPLRARALAMALAEATYVGLDPTGPWLTVTHETLP